MGLAPQRAWPDRRRCRRRRRPRAPAPLTLFAQRVQAWQRRREQARGCRECPLWADALVGEQPGDREDVQGRPFVGPAGRGWHRDAPDYELIAGVSLGSFARLRFRPWPPRKPKKDNILTLEIAPRSAYRMADTARWGWQHSVPPVPGLRYSVTMRTVRDGLVINRRQ